MDDIPRSWVMIHSNCWVDRDLQAVWHAGKCTGLSPRAWILLTTLLNHAAILVPNRVLLQAGWPESGATMLDLYPYIHRLRQAIEPNPARPQWIMTRRGVGYVLYTAETRHPLAN